MSSRSAANRWWRRQNTPEVLAFCRDHGFAYEWIAGDWHLRIEGVMDIYPGRKRFFWIPTKEWGFYNDYDSLGKIMLARIDTV